ncbi:non-hydrolyzing UDP-N-acetylglucosamine 2-epimerase [Paralcaligenes ginsengisoli]
MVKILTVLGARPQFIKASVVSEAIRQSAQLHEVVVHTGQHFDGNMSDVFFSELDMQAPQYQLDIHGGGHGNMTGRMLIAVEQVLAQEKPDIVMVYGDTNSTIAGALAAVKMHIPVAHVEAGLRSFNMRMPEEINRILTDRISQWLFTPTDTASKNLKLEGHAEDRINQVGDVMYDVALFHGAKVCEHGRILEKLRQAPKSYILATIHRAENTDDFSRLSRIIHGLIKTASTLPVIWPIHPRTKQVLAQRNMLDEVERAISLIEPVGYLDMIQLEKYAAVIITDSGGVQKEAFFHGVPCITLREETEWTELVAGGWNQLIPPNEPFDLSNALKLALRHRPEPMTPYGIGNAAQLITNALAKSVSSR